jgi:hypothetical protein
MLTPDRTAESASPIAFCQDRQLQAVHLSGHKARALKCESQNRSKSFISLVMPTTIDTVAVSQVAMPSYPIG